MPIEKLGRLFSMGKKDHKHKSAGVVGGDDIPALAKLIKSDKCKKVVLMVSWESTLHPHELY